MLNRRNASRQGFTVRDVRHANEAALLRRLFFGAPMSRRDLIRDTGLSPGTVTTLVNGLMDAGLIVEAGKQDSDGGRPRILLQVAKDRGIVVGVEVGETRHRIEAFDLELRKVAALDHSADGRDPRQLVEEIRDGIDSIVRELGVAPTALLGVGVGVSGIVERRPRSLVHAQAYGWDDVPLQELLETLGVPVLIENSAQALAQAEMWYGAARGTRYAAIALLGTGVGAGIFVDGRALRGAHASAGEWGHTPIVVGGHRCRCGSMGCLEAYVGGFAIASRWAAERELATPSSIDATDQEAAVRDLLAAVGRSRAADRIVADTVDKLAGGVATLVNLFNPERIVLQGWVGLALGPLILEDLRERAATYALRQPWGQVEIVLGQLGADAVPLGAATLVVDAILSGESDRVQKPVGPTPQPMAETPARRV